MPDFSFFHERGAETYTLWDPEKVVAQRAFFGKRRSSGVVLTFRAQRNSDHRACSDAPHKWYRQGKSERAGISRLFGIYSENYFNPDRR